MDRPTRGQFVYWPLLVMLLTILVDRVSKYFVVRFLKPLSPEGVPLLGSFLRLTYLENTGVSFGQLQDYGVLIAVFTLVVVLGLLIGYRFLVTPSRWANLALGLVMGGAVGNLIDRIVTGVRCGFARTYVVDFIDLKHFAVFNVADSAITVGGILYGVYLVFFRGQASSGERQEDKPWEAEDQPGAG